MFYIIEKEEQLAHLTNLGDCFISFIPLNNNFHDITQTISLIYVRPIVEDKGYILCVNHSESLSLDYEVVTDFLFDNTDKLYVVDKKKTMYYFPFNDKLFDLSFIKTVEVEYSKCFDFYYSKHYSLSTVNKLIPITKHYEFHEKVYRKLKKTIKTLDTDNPQYKFNNNSTCEAFYGIESTGIAIDRHKFKEHYIAYMNYPEFNIRKGRIFGQYNLYTLTGRPSNRFNNINFAALNKTSGIRECYIPDNDIFIEMDFSAYHPRLICKLIDMEFADDLNIYIYLADLMFETKDLTENQINKCKELTFKQIYGGVYDQYKHIKFFHEIDKFTNKCWEELQTTGEYKTENRIFKKDEASSPATLFNYIIQSFETTTNTKLILKIAEYLRDKQTKLVMYTYDAFLFDFSNEDGVEILEDLEYMMEYPVKIKKGNNYNNITTT